MNKVVKDRPKLSLCMIIKNEEEHLGECLESTRAFIDELIVVDTGSTDSSVAIARQHGASVFFHKWENDFARHRNQSISYATGDWILILDGDEELMEGSGPTIRDRI